MKKAILVFVDGTICDGRQRYHLMDTAEFYDREWLLKDLAVPGSVDSLNKLAERYELVYIGARPAFTEQPTLEWLASNGFPKGSLYLGEDQAERLRIIREIKGKYDFLAGIGDRWDDNELHIELGCLSIIFQEHAGDWDGVYDRINDHYRNLKISQNRVRLEGKVEGLARVCPLLLSRFGEKLWDAYFDSVLELAESTRDARRDEDLEFFKRHHLDPGNLKDAARMYELWDEEDWENDSLFGLQDRELVEATQTRYVHKVTRCYYAELWKKHGRPDIGYQIHCRTDKAWWDKPAWNPKVRFEQPTTLMQGDDACLFIQYLPVNGEK